jgi:hypothetical protein
VVLVDERLVVVVAAILHAVVDVVDVAEGEPYLVDLRLGEAIDIGTLARLSLAVGVLLGAAANASNSATSVSFTRLNGRAFISSCAETAPSPGQPSSIQSAMKPMSSSDTRWPPHGSGGKRSPSNGASPRNPLIRPELALRLSPSWQHDASVSGAIMRTP